ncbi:hypothetical protein FB451DRAFT_1481975 [Mycena latifolia]|nr:hypothetical protein FB451DRAFT_1481975 [Mycena latifolia]
MPAAQKSTEEGSQPTSLTGASEEVSAAQHRLKTPDLKEAIESTTRRNLKAGKERVPGLHPAQKRTAGTHEAAALACDSRRVPKVAFVSQRPRYTPRARDDNTTPPRPPPDAPPGVVHTEMGVLAPSPRVLPDARAPQRSPGKSGERSPGKSR